MAEKLAILRKNGGGMSETVLWTNASPTSAYPSSGTSKTETLSDNISHYKFLKFIFKRADSIDARTEIIYNAEDFAEKYKPAYAGTYFRGCVFLVRTSNSTYYFRQFYYASDTSITFHQCVNISASASGGAYTTDNHTLVPYKVVGLK